MNGPKRDAALRLLTASGGLISALITICASFPLGHYAELRSNRLLHFSQAFFLPGVVFGAIVSVCFALRVYLRDLWKAIALIVASSVAYFLSFWAAVGVSLHPFGLLPRDRIGEVTDLALVAGGLTGAFCLICTVSLLLNSRLTWQGRMLKALCWTPVGAVLGIVGWALGPSLGMTLWQIVHSLNLTAPTETFQNAKGGVISRMFSLWAVWQFGMGFVLGLVVNGKQSNGGKLA
jgi:hypothetical protein